MSMEQVTRNSVPVFSYYAQITRIDVTGPTAVRFLPGKSGRNVLTGKALIPYQGRSFSVDGRIR